MDNAKEIIEKVLETVRVKAPTFASNIGVPYQRIYDIQRGKTQRISTELGNKIVRAYPQFCLSYLLTGEGNMLKEERSEESKEPTNASDNSIVDFLKAEIAELKEEIKNLREEKERIYREKEKMHNEIGYLKGLLEGRISADKKQAM